MVAAYYDPDEDDDSDLEDLSDLEDELFPLGATAGVLEGEDSRWQQRV